MKHRAASRPDPITTHIKLMIKACHKNNRQNAILQEKSENKRGKSEEKSGSPPGVVPGNDGKESL